MAEAGFKESLIDLHSGGEDLRFPHHDNELAQSSACYKNKTWIRYFIHSGHLNIKGAKMSKSTKNFTTIKEALTLVNANTLRLYYSQTSYNKVMNFDPEQMYTQAEIIENTFKNFFRTSDRLLRDFQKDLIDLDQKFNDEDMKILLSVSKAKEKVDAAFKDNFNTPDVLLVLQDFVKKMNTYFTNNEKILKHLLVKKAVDFVKDTLYCMGMDYSLGGSTEESSMENKLLDIITNYRNQIRTLMNENNIKEIHKTNDKIRDVDMFDLGIKIEDKGTESFWVNCGYEELSKERKIKTDLIAQKKLVKQKKEQAELEQAKIKPEEIFKLNKKYDGSTFDEKGFPILKKDGTDFSKKDKKYFNKEYTKQKKRHDKYLADLEKTNDK